MVLHEVLDKVPFEVRDLINSGWDEEYLIDVTGFQGAYNLIQNAVSHTNIALVQGPAGTGKTALYQSILHDMLGRITNDNPVLYIAPTNQLVADMLQKMASVYRHTGRNINDLLNEVRIYGSLFRFNDDNRRLNDQMDENVRLVIATDYQRAANLHPASNFHVMIDEASKTPLHKSFISLAERLIRSIEEGRSILGSFSVIGDPQQAINLKPQYRNNDKNLLMMNSFIRGLLSTSVRREVDSGTRDLLDAALSELRGRYFEFLEMSWRMPSPSEVPISRGYYDDRLRARYTAGERLREWNNNLASNLRTQDERFDFPIRIIEEAMTTHRPMIYVRTEERGYQDRSLSSTYDPIRAEIGILFAVCLTVNTKDPTTVTTVYQDQRMQMEITYNRRYRPFMRMLGLDGYIRFATVDKMLGSQSENIVAILGKEYTGFDETSTTRYFQEPPLLNVQLSRHRRMIVIVGNLSQLIMYANRFHQQKYAAEYTNLRITAESIHELAGIASVPRTSRTIRISNGDGCVYAPYNDS